MIRRVLFQHCCTSSSTVVVLSAGRCRRLLNQSLTRPLQRLQRLSLLVAQQQHQYPTTVVQQPFRQDRLGCCSFRGSSFSTLTGTGSSGGGGGDDDVFKEILERVSRGELDPGTALTRIQAENSNHTNNTDHDNDDDILLKSFANLDYRRSERTGFPEAIFAQGKTCQQVATLLDSMAQNFTRKWQDQQKEQHQHAEHHHDVPTAILATRVTPDMFQELSQISLQHGVLKYHETARIVSMKPHGMSSMNPTTTNNNNNTHNSSGRRRQRIVVATAGTTDIYVAEEAAVVLEAVSDAGGGIQVDRIYDAGVAGLHRIVQALPRLRHDDVGAVIVCAGMDGALPSVVGGLVAVPVIAVPTSIGYGASFHGVSALLTMLNSCAPGVGVVNIDNGFGAAVLAFKCLGRR